MILNKALALAINRISFLKDSEKQLLSDIIAVPSDISALSVPELSAICGRSLKTTSWDPHKVLKKAEQDWNALEKGEFTLLICGTAEYPQLLSQIYDPPYVLYVRGEASILHEKSAALVGTREPDPNAESAAFRWGLSLACEDISTVSGLARGIDTAAHKGALSIKGKTAAVLGSGVDEIYPRRNLVLARSIQEHGGAIVSEFPPGTGAVRYNFPKRNRIISGLSGAVVLVQAPAKSGALITADYALEQGREVYIDASCAALPGNDGCASLLYQGACAVSAPHELHFTKMEHSGPIVKVAKSKPELDEKTIDMMESELEQRIMHNRSCFFKKRESNGGQIAG
jgi:DNA processing protein